MSLVIYMVLFRTSITYYLSIKDLLYTTELYSRDLDRYKDCSNLKDYSLEANREGEYPAHLGHGPLY